MPIFIFLLGFYQLTEFMLCSSEYVNLWARIGFATYTFLPAVMYHMEMSLAGKKVRKEVYIFATLFSGLALIHPSFILGGGCNLLHVSIQSMIFNQNQYLMITYLAYYIIYPGIGFMAFTNTITKQECSSQLKHSTRIAILMLPIAILLGQFYFLYSLLTNVNQDVSWVTSSIIVAVTALIMTGIVCVPLLKRTGLFIWSMQFVLTSSIVTLLILYAIYPQFAYDYSSIYCQFALLYALTVIFLVRYTK